MSGRSRETLELTREKTLDMISLHFYDCLSIFDGHNMNKSMVKTLSYSVQTE